MSMKPGQTTRPGGVDGLRPLGSGEADAQPSDAPVGHQHVLHGVDAVRRVEDAPVPDQEARRAGPAHAALLPARRYSTAIRTATPFDTWSRMTE